VVGIDSNAHAITTTLALAHEQGLGERVRFECHDPASQRLSRFDNMSAVPVQPLATL
jgi:hypothetical protein